MAHFAFEQQLSEAVGGFGFISLVIEICSEISFPPFLNLYQNAGANGFFHQCELHNPTPVSQTKHLQA